MLQIFLCAIIFIFQRFRYNIKLYNSRFKILKKQIPQRYNKHFINPELFSSVKSDALSTNFPKHGNFHLKHLVPDKSYGTFAFVAFAIHEISAEFFEYIYFEYI